MPARISTTLLVLQEVGLPTCVAASNKLVGVGTLRLDIFLTTSNLSFRAIRDRGAVVLLDSKLQDVPAKPQAPVSGTGRFGCFGQTESRPVRS